MPDQFGKRRWPTYVEVMQGATFEQGWSFRDTETGLPMDFTAEPGWSAKAEFDVNGTPLLFSTEPGEGIAGSITLGDNGNVLLVLDATETALLPFNSGSKTWDGGLEITAPDGEVIAPFSLIKMRVLQERVF